MKNIIYFFQFIFIILFFLIFKILRLRMSSALGGKIFQLIGPFFRSNNLIRTNILRALPNLNYKQVKEINSMMWNNYGRIFAEYMFLKNFRENFNEKHIIVDGQEILDKIKKSNTPVIFVSGHFANFELMAMQIEKSGIKLAAIYRPLNNKYLNIIMERIRKKFICKNQIKKGISGVRNILKLYKKNYCTALMIDQRVSEGIRSVFFGKPAFTTTIPAQIIKKFNCEIVPVHIERYDDIKFNLTFDKPIKFDENTSTEEITLKLNKILEKMVLKDPSQWILTHNRWK